MNMTRSGVLLLIALPVVSQNQSSLPREINPVTLSRLPPATAEDLDDAGKRLLAAQERCRARARTHPHHHVQSEGYRSRHPVR